MVVKKFRHHIPGKHTHTPLPPEKVARCHADRSSHMLGIYHWINPVVYSPL